MSDYDIEKQMKEHRKDLMFWQGFDTCLDMVLNTIDNSDMNTLPLVLREEIIYEAELYKKDG